MILAFSCSKGGVGKTTEAVHTAVALSHRGSTLLIDSDPSGVASQWRGWRHDYDPDMPNTPDVMRLEAEEIIERCDELAERYDHIVFDVGGFDNPALRASVVVSDKVLMPLSVSGFDGVHVERMVGIFKEARQWNPDMQVRVLPSLVDTRAKDQHEVTLFVREYGLQTTATTIFARKPVKVATAEGLVIEEVPGEHASKLMYRKLMREIDRKWV